MGIEPYMLEIQYRFITLCTTTYCSCSNGIGILLFDRMHPMISQFPSLHFYGGKIKDGIVASDRPSPTGISWPSEGNPIAFVNVVGFEKKRYVLLDLL